MDRRTFLDRAASLIHAVIAACAVIPGVRFLVGTRRGREGDAAFVRTIRLRDLPSGAPARVKIRMAEWDAYIHHPPGPVGAVWLLRESDEALEAAPKVRCWQTICPHLGCAIDYEPSRHAFVCPCHASEFTKTGEPEFGPSPRPMDELACRVGNPDENGDRWVEVQYQEFRTGTTEKERIT